MQPVNFSEALNRLPFDEKFEVEIIPTAAKNSGVNLIGTLVRNPNGFAFVEVEPGLAANTKLVKKTATKSKKVPAKK